MRRFVAIIVILIGSLQIAVASGVPEKVEEMLPDPEPEGTGSAAVAGRFADRPPTEARYPVDILVRMRDKLADTDGTPEKSEGDGH